MGRHGVRAALKAGELLSHVPVTTAGLDLPELGKEPSRLTGPHLEHKPSWVTDLTFPNNWVPFPGVPDQVGQT